MSDTRVIVTKYSGKCAICKNSVKEYQGFAYKIGLARWKVICRSTQCADRAGIKSEVENLAEESNTPKVRKLTAEGVLEMPFERESLSLVRSFPGARWNPNTKVWTVSLEPQDRMRMLEIADKLGLEVASSLRKAISPTEVIEAKERAINAGAYPFQVTGVEWLAGRKKALLADDMGLGKAQPLDAKILTPSGWINMGDVKVGDFVVGCNGQPTKVIGIYPQGEKTTYKVTFSDGSSTECCEEHLWTVNTPSRKNKKYPSKILQLCDFMNDLRDRAGNCKWFIPITQPVVFQEKKCSLDPYFMGYLIGNGSLSSKSPKITVSRVNGAVEVESVERLRKHCLEGIYLSPTKEDITFSLLDQHGKRFDPNSLTVILKRLDLMGKKSLEKHIPSEFLFASVKDRYALLAGLMDSDGYVSLNGSVVQYSTSSPDLARDFIHLVRSLGGVPRVSEKFPRYFYKGIKIGNLSYTINLRLDFNPFWLNRKRVRYRDRTKYKSTRAIVKVEDVGIKSMQCIQVEASDNLYLTDDFIVTHNTFTTIQSLDINSGCLAIVPASMKWVWRDEIAKWRPELRCTVLSGRSNFRYPEAGEVVVLNFEVLVEPTKPKEYKRNSKDSDKVHARKFRQHKEKVEDYERRITSFDKNLRHLLAPSKPKRPSQKSDESFADFKERVRIEQEEYKKRIEKHKEFIKQMEELHGDVTLVVDEAHAVKNYKTGRTKRITSLSKICGKTWFLTGTPLLNRPFDLWGVLSSGNMNFEVFGSWAKFLRLFGGFKGHFGYEFGDVDPSAPEFLRRVMLRRLRTEVLPDLPNKTYQTVTVDCPNNLTEELDVLWGSYQENEDQDELPSFTEFSKARANLAKSRTKAALEIVEQYEEHEIPLVVFCAHKYPVQEIAKREGWALITGDTDPKERASIVNKFQSGEIKGIGATILSAGVGLTLTRSSHALFIDLAWNPSLNTQAEDRICRIGQTAKKIQIIRMVSNHPLDQHVLNILSTKSKIIDAAIESEIKVDPAALNAQVGNNHIELVEETDEDFAIRMAKIDVLATKTERERILGKVGIKLETMRRKNGTIAPQVFSNEFRETIKSAWSFMLGSCDGARTEDGIGFNKPDAAVAHWTMKVLDDDDAIELAYRMLGKYRGQLSSFPELFKS